VRRIHNVLVNVGFEIFWDLQTPAGMDWDSWIRKTLAQSKCAVVFWSAASASSDNVRHEATIAKQQGKLISVFIEPLTALDIPMGLYAQQAAKLIDWSGDCTDNEWRKFLDACEAKLMPRWVQEKVELLEAELQGERAQREQAEAHEKVLREQIAEQAKTQQDLKTELQGEHEQREQAEAQEQILREQIAEQTKAQQDLKLERDSALSDAASFKAELQAEMRLTETLQERDKALQAQIAKQLKTEQHLKRERDAALAEVEKLKRVWR